MLKITDILTNLEFQLPPNTKIPFNFFSPIFEESKSSTFSATLSAKSAVNRRITGNYHLPGKPDNTGALIPVWFECAGERKRATFQILEADEKNIKYNLLFDEASFMVAYGNLFINECDMGGVQTIPDMITDALDNPVALPAWNNELYTKTFPEVNAAFFPVYNPNYFDGTDCEIPYKGDGDLIEGKGNCQNMPGDKQLGAEFSYQGLQFLNSKIFHPITPFPFLAYVVEQLFIANGYRVTENYMRKNQLSKLCIINNVDTAISEFSVANGELIWLKYERDKYDIANHLPEKSVKKFLEAIKNKFNIHPVIDESSKTVRLINLDDVLKQPVNESDDYSNYISAIKLKTIPNYTGYAFIDNGNHDDNYTKYIKDIREFEQQIVEPPFTDASQRLDGNFKLNEIRQNNLYAFATPSYYEKLTELNNIDTGKIVWTFYSWTHEGNLYYGDKAKEIRFESEISHLMSSFYMEPTVLRFDDGAGGVQEELFTLPVWYKVGNSEIIPEPNIDEGINLMFYEGIKQNINNINYPLATHNNNNLGIGDMSLSYHRVNGLVYQHWRHTLNFFMNRGKIYEYTPNLSVSKLLNFDWAKKYIIKEGTFMVKNIKGEFNYDGSITYKSSELVEC